MHAFVPSEETLPQVDQPQTAADLEYRIAKLSLEAGDVLVVKINHTISAEIGGKIRESFERVVRGNRVLILDNSMELSVLTKADIEQRVG